MQLIEKERFKKRRINPPKVVPYWAQNSRNRGGVKVAARTYRQTSIVELFRGQREQQRHKDVAPTPEY